MKQSFLTVKRFNSLLSKIDKEKKYRAAKAVRNYKRCVFNTEDTYRASVNMAANAGKGFLDILDPEATLEIVNLHKQLNPEDFNSVIFNSIMKSQKVFSGANALPQQIVSSLSCIHAGHEETPKASLERLFE